MIFMDKYFGVPFSIGAMEMNNDCDKAPAFFSQLFKKKVEILATNKKDIDEIHDSIYLFAKKAFAGEVKAAEKRIFFGGTHDITAFIFKAFSEQNKKPKLLILDAHADCEDLLGSVSHEDFAKFLVRNKIVKKENIMIVGLRKVSKIEKIFLKRNMIKHFYYGEKTDVMLKAIKKFVSVGQIYLSFDVDMLNSEIMKATGYFPNGGFYQEETKKMLNLCVPVAKAIDIVEFNPIKANEKEKKLIKELFLF